MGCYYWGNPSSLKPKEEALSGWPGKAGGISFSGLSVKRAAALCEELTARSIRERWTWKRWVPGLICNYAKEIKTTLIKCINSWKVSHFLTRVFIWRLRPTGKRCSFTRWVEAASVSIAICIKWIWQPLNMVVQAAFSTNCFKSHLGYQTCLG